MEHQEIHRYFQQPLFFSFLGRDSIVKPRGTSSTHSIFQLTLIFKIVLDLLYYLCVFQQVIKEECNTPIKESNSKPSKVISSTERPVSSEKGKWESEVMSSSERRPHSSEKRKRSHVSIFCS